MKVLHASQIRKADLYTIEHEPIASIDLMERASRAFLRAFPTKKYIGHPIHIFCGPGNNGGDGLVIARILAGRLARPVVFLLFPSDKLKGDSAHNYSRLLEFPTKIIEVKNEENLHGAPAILANCWTVVDGIFGTGLTREVSGIFAAAIRIINEASCPVVAVDIPSGINTDNGETL